MLVGGNLKELQVSLERATFGQRKLNWGGRGPLNKRPREGGGERDSSGRGREGGVGSKGTGWEAMGSGAGIGEAESGTALGSSREEDKCSNTLEAVGWNSGNGGVENCHSD